MGSGYIKLHRSIQDNFLWKSEPFSKAQAWVDLLLSANYADGGFFMRGIWIEVKRGQTARSELTLSKEWKWSRGKIRRFIGTLVKNKMVDTKQDNKTTVISIRNYEKYQPLKNEDGTTNDTASGTPNGHQTDINNKNNKDNKNKEKNIYPEDSKEFRLSLYLLNKIRERKPDLKIPDLQKWSQQSDFIFRIDKRNASEIKSAIDWCQTDEFWQDNILSTTKLRKHYDKLVLKMNKTSNPSTNPDTKSASRYA